jgi:hypothetical protein
MWNRINYAQLQLNSDVSLLRFTKSNIDTLHLKNNLAFDIIKMMIMNDFQFNFNSSLYNTEIGNPKQMSLNQFCTTHNIKIIPQIRKSWTKLQLVYVEQLIDEYSIHILSWSQLHKARNLGHRGRIPK